MKIYIITHKNYEPVTHNALYETLLVGADINKFSAPCRKDNDFVGNISFKNPDYCELTGLYWIWKNSSEDVVGLCHYRRYFTKSKWLWQKKRILDQEKLREILKGYDIILPIKRKYATMTAKEHFVMCHDALSWSIMKRVVNDKYPEYMEDFTWFEDEKSGYCYNMFVMDTHWLELYCTWLFGILFEVENRLIQLSGEGPKSRIFGFLSERLINVWVRHNSIRVYETPIYFSEEKTPVQKTREKILKKLHKQNGK